MDFTQYTKGLYIIGKLTEFNDGETVAFFLSPKGQALVRDTFVEHAKRANEADQDGGGVTTTYDGEEAFKRLDDLVRYRLEQAVQTVVEEHEEEVKTQRQELNEQRNKPHEAGTTTELAARLGVSKNALRKMKRDGTLDDALAKLGD